MGGMQRPVDLQQASRGRGRYEYAESAGTDGDCGAGALGGPGRLGGVSLYPYANGSECRPAGPNDHITGAERAWTPRNGGCVEAVGRADSGELARRVAAQAATWRLDCAGTGV